MLQPEALEPTRGVRWKLVVTDWQLWVLYNGSVAALEYQYSVWHFK